MRIFSRINSVYREINFLNSVIAVLTYRNLFDNPKDYIDYL